MRARSSVTWKGGVGDGREGMAEMMRKGGEEWGKGGGEKGVREGLGRRVEEEDGGHCFFDVSCVQDRMF